MRGKLKAVVEWWREYVLPATAPQSTAGMATALEQVQREHQATQANEAREREAAAALERQRAERQVELRQEPQRQAEVKRPVQKSEEPVLRPRGPRL